METILLLLHTDSDHALPPAALETVSALLSVQPKLGSPSFVVGLVGEDPHRAAQQLARCGAQRFLAVAGPEFAASRYATDAAAAEAICRAAQATLVLAPATPRWNRVLAGVAQRLAGRVDSHVTSLAVEDGQLTVNRWFYRQRMEAALRRDIRPWIMLVEPGTHARWQGAAGSVTLEMLTVPVPDSAQRTTVRGIREPASDVRTIRPEADLLFVAGAGWTKKQADSQPHLKEAEQLILGFLQCTRASLGSSKSLVDQQGEGHAVLSFLTHLNQIGQTGSTPRHPKGLATCCHGEEPHTVGWRFVQERRAINLDPNCGWARGKADVLYVADAFAVLAKLNALLSNAQTQV